MPPSLAKIFEHTFEDADDDEVRRIALPLATLTCRTFHPHALDYPWSKLASLAPLIKCFPRDLWAPEITLSSALVIMNHLLETIDSDSLLQTLVFLEATGRRRLGKVHILRAVCQRAAPRRRLTAVAHSYRLQRL